LQHVFFIFLFNNQQHHQQQQVAITQTISGTGALRVGGEFFARWFPTSKKIFVPTPTWGNHIPIFKDSGLEVNHYKYFDKKTNGLDFEGMVADIKVTSYLSFYCHS